ncbi:MAG: glycosyltransferase [Candidatus Parcubacteria bacterium]|nr:glycosyltransferase [Candidatus Parcubacteria bacterium]
MEKILPTISVCMATLNAEKILPECLDRLFKQNYPMGKIELIVSDGGSQDRTQEIIKNYEGKIFENPLKTGEAGKAVAVKQAKNDLILILDSDNQRWWLY